MTKDLQQYVAVRLSLGLFTLVVLGVSSLVVIHAWPAVFPSHLTSGCGCAILTPTLPPAQRVLTGGALITAAMLLGSFSFHLIRSFIRQRRFQQQISQRIHARPIHQPTGQSLTIVVDSRPQAFTLGLFRPRIYLTTGLLRRLSKSEIHVVISHEAVHLQAHDPLVASLLEALSRAWGWMPWIRTWVDAAANLRELVADSVATGNYDSTVALTGAVSKLVEPATVGVAAMSPNTSRVEKLLNHDWQPRWRLWRWQYLVGAAGIIVGLVLLSRTPTARAQTTTPGQCHQLQVMCRQAEQIRFEDFVCQHNPDQCLNGGSIWPRVQVVQLMSVDAQP